VEVLNPLDAQFVDAENEETQISMAIASIAVFAGPAPTYEEFLSAIEGRLPEVPIYRRKLRAVPFSLGPPVWVDAHDFDLRYHVRQTALPPPGDDGQLRSLMARVMGQRLDRDYPLWEYWLVQGLSKGRWALISKVHHAMVDGVSGTDLYRVIFDQTPEPPAPAAVGSGDGSSANGKSGDSSSWRAGAPPSPWWLAARAALDMMSLPARTGLALGTALSKPAATLRQAAEVARATAKLTSSARPAVKSSLSGPIGRQRRYAWTTASLSDVKVIKNELGGTVNDVVLAAISSGYRALLLARGEQPAPHMVPSLVPVSVRAAGEENIYENRVSVLVADLPVDIADPVERLDRVRSEMAAVKGASEASAAVALVKLGRYTPYPVASLVVRLAYRLPQTELVTVTTNVPGPRQPLYGMGRELVEMIPYVPIAASLRTGVAIISYCDTLTFGITADYTSNPDIDVLARGIDDGVAELLAAARTAAANASATRT